MAQAVAHPFAQPISSSKRSSRYHNVYPVEVSGSAAIPSAMNSLTARNCAVSRVCEGRI